MVQEKTLFLVKPDLVRNGMYTNMLATIYRIKGLSIAKLEMVSLDDRMIDALYLQHLDKPFFPELKSYIQSGPCIVAEVVGENAVAKVMELTGATDPKDAHITSLRALYGNSKEENGCHRSDSVDNALRELNIIFSI